MKTGKRLTRILAFGVTASLSTVLVGGLPATSNAAPERAWADKVCAPSVVILTSSVQPQEAQARALNDPGDVVGFADGISDGISEDKAISELRRIDAVVWSCPFPR